jgi:hypothetical protein
MQKLIENLPSKALFRDTIAVFGPGLSFHRTQLWQLRRVKNISTMI